MSHRLSLQQVLEKAPWYGALQTQDQELVQRTSSENLFAADGFIVRVGDPSTHWIGVIQGLLQMTVVTSDGRETTLSCVGEGQWCGEGSLLKRERRRYDAIALRTTRIAMVPLETFFHLRDVNIAFNHYLQDLMNARMSSFIATLEADRLLGPEQRVAKCISTLCRHMSTAANMIIYIPQHELALICGLSRQRTNAALQTLEQSGYIEVDFKSLKVVNPADLNAYGTPPNKSA